MSIISTAPSAMNVGLSNPLMRRTFIMQIWQGLPSWPFNIKNAAKHPWATTFALIQNKNIRLTERPDIELWSAVKSLKATDRLLKIVYSGCCLCCENSCPWKKRGVLHSLSPVKLSRRKWSVRWEWQYWVIRRTGASEERHIEWSRR